MLLRTVMLQQALCCRFDLELGDAHAEAQSPHAQIHPDAGPRAYEEECRPYMFVL
jgi:hypothetical protein